MYTNTIGFNFIHISNQGNTFWTPGKVGQCSSMSQNLCRDKLLCRSALELGQIKAAVLIPSK